MLIDNAFRADTRNLTPETKSHALIHPARCGPAAGLSESPAVSLLDTGRVEPCHFPLESPTFCLSPSYELLVVVSTVKARKEA